MGRINSRQKGAAGEREFCDWLEATLELDEKPQRELDQPRDGGIDIILEPFAFEVKRCQKLELGKWWQQALEACGKLLPIVAYRQNRGKWTFLVPAWVFGIGSRGYIILPYDVGRIWIIHKYSVFLAKQRSKE